MQLVCAALRPASNVGGNFLLRWVICIEMRCCWKTRASSFNRTSHLWWTKVTSRHADNTTTSISYTLLSAHVTKMYTFLHSTGSCVEWWIGICGTTYALFHWHSANFWSSVQFERVQHAEQASISPYCSSCNLAYVPVIVHFALWERETSICNEIRALEFWWWWTTIQRPVPRQAWATSTCIRTKPNIQQIWFREVNLHLIQFS